VVYKSIGTAMHCTIHHVKKLLETDLFMTINVQKEIHSNVVTVSLYI